MEHHQDLARLLPDDLLAEALRRLAPRDLAACRCACTAWRALVDGRRLLRADLLPLSLAGLFVCYDELPFAELFARPSAGGYSTPRSCVEDHCNGLLLHEECVSNPATGGLLPLPERPPPPRLLHYYECVSNPAATGLLPLPRAVAVGELVEYGYLAFDPAASPDYEVFLVPSISRSKLPRLDAAMLRSEWPPSPFRLSVLSSRTRRWEERRLVREGEPAGTVADMVSSDGHGFSVAGRRAVCWHGALYVHQHKDFVIRISLSNHTYRVIKPPKGIDMFKYRKPHLGKSQKGVYYALTDDKSQLWAWILDESCGKMKWVLRHDGSQGLLLPILNCDKQAHGPWILDNVNSNEGDINAEQVEQEFEWDSDDGETINHTEFKDRAGKDHGFGEYIEILGFHPYKEIIFLLERSYHRGLSYHLKSSKLEDLGNLYSKGYSSVDDYNLGYIEDAFPYTPCWLGEFPENMESWPI